MSVEVMGWVWRSSRSKSSQRLVLLAIADCASADGANAYPSMAELVRKTGLGERTVQEALRKLISLGELIVSVNAGPNGCNRYRVVMDDSTPAESAPPQNPHPAKSAVRQKAEAAQVETEDPAESAPPAKSAPPQNRRRNPAESAPGTVIEPSENSSSKSSTKGDRGKRGTRIPDDFAVTPEMVAWARDRCPTVDGRRETEKFTLFWQSKATGATKVNWGLAWKHWMLNAADRPSYGQRASPPSTAPKTIRAGAQCPRHEYEPADGCQACASEHLGRSA